MYLERVVRGWVHVYVYVCMGEHRLEVSIGYLPQSFCTLFSETASLIEPGASWFSEAGCPLSFKDLRVTDYITWFFHNAGDPSVHPHP